jgi:mannose-6-phosphate isomerase-like protein (cupin superfamily)
LSIFTGLFRSRDKPTNRVGGGWSFLFGNTVSGKTVNERTAMQTTAVYACVRILAEAVAGLPLHIYRSRSDGGKERVPQHPLFHLLHDEPNSEMTSFVFRETLMSHLLLWGNAYAQIVRNGRGQVIVLYPLLGLPILCMNCRDMIVSASSEGILVSEKHQSSKIKPYVEKIERLTRSEKDLCRSRIVLDVQNNSLTAKIRMEADQKITCPICGDCDKRWTVTGGNGVVAVDAIKKQVRSGDCVTIPAGCRHEVIAGSSGMQIIEIQIFG